MGKRKQEDCFEAKLGHLAFSSYVYTCVHMRDIRLACFIMQRYMYMPSNGYRVMWLPPAAAVKSIAVRGWSYKPRVPGTQQLPATT